ncbi:MAG TPA: GAF domain-containing protein [Candidatus Methylomirabilis sp.]|nr:GAF domain-containing protein [Candidatus Methylomirabilis sp.]
MSPDERWPQGPETLPVLYESGRAFSSTLDLDQLLPLIPRKAAEVLQARTAILRLVDGETRALRVASRFDADGGTAWAAVDEMLAEVTRREAAPVLVPDLNRDARFACPAGAATASALCIPLHAQDDVIGTLGLYEKWAYESAASAALLSPFGDRDLQALTALGVQAAIAIQNARLFGAAAQQATEISLLQEIGQAIASRLELSEVLEAVVAGAMRLLGSEMTQIRLWDEEQQTLRYGSAQGSGAERIRNQRFEMGKGVNAAVALTRQPMILNEYQASPYALPGFEDVVATITTPVMFGDRLLGVLHSHSTQPGKRFAPADLRLLQMLATQAAIAIENARLFAAAHDRRRQLEAVRAVTEEITQELDVSTLLRLITRRAVELLRAGSGTVWLWDPADQALTPGAWHGRGEWMRGRRLKLGEGVAGAAAERRAGLLVNDYAASPHAVPLVVEQGNITTMLAEPLVYRDRLLGVIALDNQGTERIFTEKDRQTLALFANQAAIAIENARLFHESQRLTQENVLRLRTISILNEIGMAMQGTMHLDALLHVILTGATFGEGLGFNRAMLLLVDEPRNVLEGRMGIGPSSGEEAAQIWGALTSETRTLRDVIAERATQLGKQPETAFDRFARSLKIPLESDAGVLALTALEGRPFRVTDARHDPRVNPEWEGRLDVDEFACVPLAAKARVVGVIAVDNKFNRRPITDQDLEFLSVFAAQAGLAVGSAQVYKRLEDASREIQRSQHRLLQQERLAALGEMAAHVVHEIRNPLVSIGGFARRLAQRLRGREPEGQYAQIIAREVDRLERIVRDVGGLSRQVHLSLVETDVHELLQECLVLFAERIAHQHIQLRMALTRRNPVLALDPVQVKQAILNLLANALEAMPEGGTLSIGTQVMREEAGQVPNQATGQLGTGDGVAMSPESSIRPVDKLTEWPRPDEWMVISVADTGGGIPQDILDEVFNPFFTTKEAGTGLGLPLVRRVARAHGGRVEVENRPGEEVTFRLYLPVGETGRSPRTF